MDSVSVTVAGIEFSAPIEPAEGTGYDEPGVSRSRMEVGVADPDPDDYGVEPEQVYAALSRAAGLPHFREDLPPEPRWPDVVVAAEPEIDEGQLIDRVCGAIRESGRDDKVVGAVRSVLEASRGCHTRSASARYVSFG